MNRIKFELLLDESLERMEGGERLESILEDNQSHRDQLEPLLLAAQAQANLPSASFEDQARLGGRNRLLAEADRLRKEGYFSKNGTKPTFLRYLNRWTQFIGNLVFGEESVDMKLASRLVLYTVVTILIAGFFTVNASASSLPGDSLYSVKISWEQARLLFAISDDSKTELETQFEEERLNEVEALIGTGRVEQVEFSGTVESMEGEWVISGISVLVDGSTEIKGAFDLGSLVKVEAITQSDGTLLAVEIAALDPGADLEGEDSGIEDETSSDDSDQEAEESDLPDDSSDEDAMESMDDQDDDSIEEIEAEDEVDDSSSSASSSSADEEQEKDSDSGSEDDHSGSGSGSSSSSEDSREDDEID